MNRGRKLIYGRPNPTGSMKREERKALDNIGPCMKAGFVAEARPLKRERMIRITDTEKCPYYEDWIDGKACDRCSYNPDEMIDCVGIESEKCPLEYAPISDFLVKEIHDEYIARPKARVNQCVTKAQLIEFLFPNTDFTYKEVNNEREK